MSNVSLYSNYWNPNTCNAFPTTLYGQDVVDGYKRMIKESNEECTKLREEIICLKNQVRQLKAKGKRSQSN